MRRRSSLNVGGFAELVMVRGCFASPDSGLVEGFCFSEISGFVRLGRGLRIVGAGVSR